MNYHSRMVNIPTDRAKMLGVVGDATREKEGIGWHVENAYKLGHRDARHAAAEIANEADMEIAALTDDNTTYRVRIKELEAQVGRLTGANQSLQEERDEVHEMLERVTNDRDNLARKAQEPE